jgi:hypothetical protein
MTFDSRDLTVKLMADSQEGGCKDCTQTQQQPGCEGCTGTRRDDEECNDCTLTQTDLPTDQCQPHEDGHPHRRNHAPLTALRQQLREALGQAG